MSPLLIFLSFWVKTFSLSSLTSSFMVRGELSVGERRITLFVVKRLPYFTFPLCLSSTSGRFLLSSQINIGFSDLSYSTAVVPSFLLAPRGSFDTTTVLTDHLRRNSVSRCFLQHTMFSLISKFWVSSKFLWEVPRLQPLLH